MNIIKAEVNFDQSKLITVKQDGIEFVAMRPIVEALGLAWQGQAKKLKNGQLKQWCKHIITPTNNGEQEMVYLQLKKLNGWLFSINPEKVKESLRDKLIKYQEECFTALHDYWTLGQATRKVIPLTQAEIEAHDIVKFDAVTFNAASKGSGAMTTRKIAKKIIKSRIEAWQEKYQLQFNYQLVNSPITAVNHA